MKKKSTFFIISLLIFVGTACSSNTANTSNPPGSDTANSNNSEIVSPTESGSAPQKDVDPIPLAESTVDVTTEEGSTTTAIIGPEGGSLSTVDGNGTQYTLVIPENALFYYEEISMTPIASAEGDVIGDTFQAGVRLEPDGLHFFQPVILEMTGAAIEEGAVGFTSQSDGQAFHLHPSTYADGTLTLNLIHFSDPGAADGNLQERMDLIEDSTNEMLEHLVAIGNSQQQMAELTNRAEFLQDPIINGLDDWKGWGDDIFSLLSLVANAHQRNQWNRNTPGYAGLLEEIRLLIDYWYITTDDIVKDIGGKCNQGEVSYMVVAQVIRTAHFGMNNFFHPGDDNFRFEKFEEWEKTLKVCTNWILVWQANVETTGVQSFYSDISLGAEVEFNFNNAQLGHLSDPASTPVSFFSSSTPLEVEYIQGFWDGLCAEPTTGSITLQLKVDYNPKNFWTDRSKVFGKIIVETRIDELIYIDCSQGLLTLNADAEKFFHGEALVQLNKDRLQRDFWVYDLAYKPGDGVIAQFKEGAPWSEPLTISWDQGSKWNLAQLVTLYTPNLPD